MLASCPGWLGAPSVTVMQTQSGIGPWSMLRASFVTCVAVTLLTGCGGSGSGATSDSSSTAESTDPTAISGYVTVQGHDLSYDCGGEGSPTVIFMHGLGGQSADWGFVSSMLTDAHWCRFDRVNAGDSEHVAARHSVMDSVTELHDFAAAAGLTPPYILAPHSFGGLIALIYAGTYPDEVSGLLLADTMLPLDADLDAQYLPPEEVEALRVHLDNNPENVDVYAGYAQAKALLAALPDVPITYMFGTLQEPPVEFAWPPGVYEASLSAFMESLPQGRLVEANADHDIPRDIPEDVVTEIELLLAE